MKTDMTIEMVTNAGLCTGCGTCEGICPRDALEMVLDYREGLYLPSIDRQKCNECGLCFEVCPGHAVDFRQLDFDTFGKEPEDAVLGNYLNCYLTHASNYDIRYNSASGGLITALLIFALEEKLIDGALVTKMKGDNPLEPQPFIARTREEIISASKSKYCPVPANVALKDILKSKEGERFAVVGLPCHIHGIRKAEKLSKKLREKIVLHFGIVCGHSDTFWQTDFLLRKYGIDRQSVAQLDYRGHGWPGYLTVRTKNGIEKNIFFDEYIGYHELWFFAHKRCALCCDIVSRLADISFMDAWLPEIRAQDKIGRSIVISRTKAGEQLCQAAILRKYVAAESISSSKVAQSQGKSRISNSDLKAHYAIARLFGRPVPKYTLHLPQSRIVNYVRAVVIQTNICVSSKRRLHRLVGLLLKIEARIFHQAKSQIQ